eukprot:gnl/MRDRNA2_/MRDRNA2_152097_c0_seq1.p1 gnl/MRDRNA2_/MRDRNA2_152097_c0~~gnl/MRDRNA2_/MRDRNA2_152097_c0_seq1.p1  ORF type:complete len:522 (+),score=68.72 gnl/MRDRNA2_/MRDRNA2_152097_c0_seq1:159-1724(+)
MLRCLGDTWFGKDVDSICSYNTPKIVKFRHRELGCVSRTLQVLIVLYIFVFLMLYSGKHFEVSSVHGLHQLRFHHPTQNMCNPKKLDCQANFTSFDQLPYCSESGHGSGVRLPCMHVDGIGLPVPYTQGVIVPTRIRRFSQEKCEGSAADANQSDCSRIWEYLDADGNKQQEAKGKPIEQHYVGDIERFTLMIDHSYMSEELGVGHDDFQMQGYYMDCDHKGKHNLNRVDCVKKPLPCMHRKCKPWMVMPDDAPASTQSFLASANDDEDEDEEIEFRDFEEEDDDDDEPGIKVVQDVAPDRMRHDSVHKISSQGFTHLRHRHQRHRHPHHLIEHIKYPEVGMLQTSVPTSSSPLISIGHGDVLTVGTMLKLAGVDLNHNHFGKPFRYRGLVLVIRITYSNKKPWTLWQPIAPPEYTIEMFRRPSYEYKLDQPMTQYAGSSQGSNDKRLFMSYHGIYVVVEQKGELQHFSAKHLLIMIAGALGLLKGASILTDFIACNFIRDHAELKSMKYEESRDFYPNRA